MRLSGNRFVGLIIGIFAVNGLTNAVFPASANDAAHTIDLSESAQTLSDATVSLDISADLSDTLSIDLQPAELLGTDSIAEYWMSISSEDDLICLTARFPTEPGASGTTCQKPFEFQRTGLQIRLEENGEGTVAHLLPKSVSVADINILTKKIDGYTAPNPEIPHLIAVDTATADKIGRLPLSRDIGDVMMFDPMTEPTGK